MYAQYRAAFVSAAQRAELRETAEEGGLLRVLQGFVLDLSTFSGWHGALLLRRLEQAFNLMFLKKKKKNRRRLFISKPPTDGLDLLFLSPPPHMPTLLSLQAADASGKMFTVRPNVLGLVPLRSSGG